MIALDTSVVVALFATWHEGHSVATAAVREAENVRLPAHAALETFSVLTRLPPPYRVGAEPVVGFLNQRFPRPWLPLAEDDPPRLLQEARDIGLVGGAVYDALVARTASRAGALLLSRDRRASATYRALGVDHRLLL